MAIAVIGGLLVSTLLSLLFVPAFFLLMDDLSRFFAWVFGRFVGEVDEPAGEEPTPDGRLDPHVVPYPAQPTRIAAE